MKQTKRKLGLLLATTPLFLAALCDPADELIGPSLERNAFKVRISEAFTYAVNDTLWINGKVSSMLVNSDTGDSVPSMEPSTRDIISVMRLVQGDDFSNTEEALDQFSAIASIGSTDVLGACPESELIAIAPIAASEAEFEYRVGLVALAPGDYVLSWLEPVRLRNGNLNTELLDNYPVSGRDDYLGLTKCGVGYSVENVSQERRSFFFTVE
ncbi:hypothetical protein ABV409_15375 [Flagellimonas sp. DF-77]|uniref:hypothetical protein n=1 Tax=Flagellimonas algarum TaxID=3230298 RepID=UPI003391DAF9